MEETEICDYPACRDFGTSLSVPLKTRVSLDCGTGGSMSTATKTLRDEPELPADVAALSVHIMTNTALTGATYDIDGGQQFVAA